MSPDLIEQVALVSGRIIHAGTGQAVLGSLRITAREGPVIDKLLGDGTFVLSGRPELLFPNIGAQDYVLNLNIRVTSAQFRQGVVTQQLSVPIPQGSPFDRPLSAGSVSLPADPVNIRGRVVGAKNPQIPIHNAVVEVLHCGLAVPPATTDAEGGYRFDEIAISAPAHMRCSATGFKPEKRILLIDFGKLMNEEHFRLPPL